MCTRARAPWPSRAYINTIEQAWAIAAANNQSYPEAGKYQRLSRCLIDGGIYAWSVQPWEGGHSALAERTFRALADHVILADVRELPAAAATTGHAGYQAAAPPQGYISAAQASANTQAAVDAAIAQANLALVNANAVANGRRRATPLANATAATPRQNERRRGNSWCDLHGRCFHTTATCRGGAPRGAGASRTEQPRLEPLQARTEPIDGVERRKFN